MWRAARSRPIWPAALPSRPRARSCPTSLPQLRAYLDEEMVPAFARLGFTTPDLRQSASRPRLRCCWPRHFEDASLPTVLGYGHGDVIRGLEDQWTKGKGPWIDGPRWRAALRPRHGRQQGPAHHQHGRARSRAGRTRRQARLQCQVHHRDGRGSGLQGPGRAGGRPQSGLRRRRARCLRRSAREAGATHPDARLPRRHQFRSRL